MFELADSVSNKAKIKVVGVGGGGGNAVNHMIRREVEGVEFIAANTDAQALQQLGVRTAVQLGPSITKGLGAGADPEVGRQAACEERDIIGQTLEGADMVFITAGMGGGTGTGAAPVIAEVAQEAGILTVAVVTRPFWWENRDSVAEQGIEELARHVDSLIIVPNSKLLEKLDAKVSLLDAFATADDVLLRSVQGIAELVLNTGIVNVDFADVRKVMHKSGLAVMGTGIQSGENRAEDATQAAISSPLLDDVCLEGANAVLVNVTAGDLQMQEVAAVGEAVHALATQGATVIIGADVDASLGEDLKVTIVATGLREVVAPQEERGKSPAGKLNYDQFDEPPFARSRKPAGPRRAEPAPVATPTDDFEFLDLRAFAQR